MAITDYDAFLADVLKSVPEDKRTAFEEVLKTEAVAKELKNAGLRQSEFSRAMDDLKTKTERWESWYADVSQQVASIQQENEQYKALYGDVDSTGDEGGRPQPQTPQPKGLTEAQLAAELTRRDQLAIQFADVLTDLKDMHKETFGERLNTRELIDYCTRSGLPLEAGYRGYTADRLEAKRKTEFDVELKKAREEGAREALSSHNLPVAPTPTEAHVFDRTDVKTDPNERLRAVVDSFNRREHHTAR